MISLQRFFLTVFASLIAAAPSVVFGGTRIVQGTQSSSLKGILRDNIRDRIYVLDAGTAELVVLDVATETVVQRILISAWMSDMDQSKDGRLLMIAAGAEVFIVNLNTLQATSVNPGVGELSSIATGKNGRVFLSTTEYWGDLYEYDLRTGQIVNEFGLGVGLTSSVYKFAYLRTNDAGDELYVMERGLSPTSLTRISVAGPQPVFVAEDDHGDLGSNGKDIAISPTVPELYVACGAPYGIQNVDMNTIEVSALYSTGPYPNGVEIDPRGEFVFGINGSNSVFQFHADTGLLQHTYSLISTGNWKALDRGIAVDRRARKIFVLQGETFGTGAGALVQAIDIQ